MQLAKLKKSLPERFYIEWREGNKDSPIRVKLKPKYKKEAATTAAKWLDIVSGMIGRREIYTGKEARMKIEYENSCIIATIYRTGTVMLQGEKSAEWLTVKTDEILRELEESKTESTEVESNRRKTNSDRRNGNKAKTDKSSLELAQPNSNKKEDNVKLAPKTKDAAHCLKSTKSKSADINQTAYIAALKENYYDDDDNDNAEYIKNIEKAHTIHELTNFSRSQFRLQLDSGKSSLTRHSSDSTSQTIYSAQKPTEEHQEQRLTANTAAGTTEVTKPEAKALYEPDDILKVEKAEDVEGVQQEASKIVWKEAINGDTQKEKKQVYARKSDDPQVKRDVQKVDMETIQKNNEDSIQKDEEISQKEGNGSNQNEDKVIEPEAVKTLKETDEAEDIVNFALDTMKSPKPIVSKTEKSDEPHKDDTKALGAAKSISKVTRTVSIVEETTNGDSPRKEHMQETSPSNILSSLSHLLLPFLPTHLFLNDEQKEDAEGLQKADPLNVQKEDAMKLDKHKDTEDKHTHDAEAVQINSTEDSQEEEYREQKEGDEEVQNEDPLNVQKEDSTKLPTKYEDKHTHDSEALEIKGAEDDQAEDYREVQKEDTDNEQKEDDEEKQKKYTDNIHKEEKSEDLQEEDVEGVQQEAFKITRKKAMNGNIGDTQKENDIKKKDKARKQDNAWKRDYLQALRDVQKEDMEIIQKNNEDGKKKEEEISQKEENVVNQNEDPDKAQKQDVNDVKENGYKELLKDAGKSSTRDTEYNRTDDTEAVQKKYTEDDQKDADEAQKDEDADEAQKDDTGEEWKEVDWRVLQKDVYKIQNRKADDVNNGNSEDEQKELLKNMCKDDKEGNKEEDKGNYKKHKTDDYKEDDNKEKDKKEGDDKEVKIKDQDKEDDRKEDYDKKERDDKKEEDDQEDDKEEDEKKNDVHKGICDNIQTKRNHSQEDSHTNKEGNNQSITLKEDYVRQQDEMKDKNKEDDKKESDDKKDDNEDKDKEDDEKKKDDKTDADEKDDNKD